ncbi:MAG TPA: SDR family oxidoreductase [Conexibacter sp.]|nr:SDR family oxidoreductase [Conexibacter sp.]
MRRVLVTGAASGIGKATALLLRERGAEVVATDRSADGLAELEGSGAEVVVGDVTRAEDRARMLAAAGDADGLVNAAGVMRVIPLAEVADEDWDAILDVNLKAAFFLARELGARMVSGGSIVNLASVAARRGDNAEVLCYAASKAAVLAVTRSLAHAFGARGVRVNAVLPGLIDTPMQDAVLARVSEIRGVPRDELEAGRLKPVVLEHRAGTPGECAESIAFLLSDASSYITGQALSVDGGIVMP